MSNKFKDFNKKGLKFNSKGIFFNEKSIYFWSGEFPYYRINSEQWEDRIIKIKAAGINFITAYVPWNLHEKEEGKYEFTAEGLDDRCRLNKFIQTLKKHELYLILKPGPFICAEVQHGGIPDWLTEKYPEIIMLDSKNKPVGFRQDKKPLPDFLNDTYLKYVTAWYKAIYENILKEFEYPKGPIVAMQIENELPYSTSELADPFSWGYSEKVISLYREWLSINYCNIENYNKLHQCNYKDFQSIDAPRKLNIEITDKKQWLRYQDWVSFKEDYGVKVLHTYGGIFRNLGVSIPFYHNAGMLEDEAPMNLGSLSDTMWMGVNFWLSNPPEEDIDAYVQGIRRLKQLSGGQHNYPNFAPELNWGWSNTKEADFLTRYTMPFLKGTNIYTIVDGKDSGELMGKPYTNNPNPYPGKSPIDAYGNLTESYQSLKQLTEFTESEGEAFNLAEYEADIYLGFYTSYNYSQVYSKYGGVDKKLYENKIRIPIGCNEFMQYMMKGFIEKNIDYKCVDIKRASTKELSEAKALIVLCQEIMDLDTQEKLIEYVKAGGKLIVFPQVPELDLNLLKATAIKDSLFSEIALHEGKANYKELLEDNKNWSAITFQEEIIAVRKKVAAGEFIYVNNYANSKDICLNILAQLNIMPSYSFSDKVEVESILLYNKMKRFNYIFIINRGSSEEECKITYRKICDGTYKSIKIKPKKKSVSIIKLANEEVKFVL